MNTAAFGGDGAEPIFVTIPRNPINFSYNPRFCDVSTEAKNEIKKIILG